MFAAHHQLGVINKVEGEDQSADGRVDQSDYFSLGKEDGDET